MFATLIIRRILVAGGLAVLAHEGEAQMQDNFQAAGGDSALCSEVPLQKANAKTDGCIEFGNPEHTSRFSKYEIRKPGRYCLTENLHARFDMADHAAESTMILIRAGNVVLDLQGHTLGRGWIFKNPGGLGIQIVDPDSYAQGIGKAKNIVIKNGTLQDFKTGVLAGRWDDTIADTPTFDAQSNTYHFPYNNITLENIIFKNNNRNFDISAPGAAKK